MIIREFPDFLNPTKPFRKFLLWFSEKVISLFIKIKMRFFQKNINNLRHFYLKPPFPLPVLLSDAKH